MQKAWNLLQGIEGEPGPWKTAEGAEDRGRPRKTRKTRKTAEDAEDRGRPRKTAEDAEDAEDWPRPTKGSEGRRGPGSAGKAAVSKEGL